MTDEPQLPSDDQRDEEARHDLRRRLEEAGLPRLALVAAVVAGVALVSARFFGDPTGLPMPTGIKGGTAPDRSVEEVVGPRICHADILRDRGGCWEIGSLRTPEGRAKFEEALPSRPITMVHPTDMAMAPREVETCESFVPLREAGWGGLSSADMRREAVFVRVCGLMLLAQDYEPLADGRALEDQDLSKVDWASLPGIGEAAFEPGAVFEADETGSFALSSPALRGRMIPVAVVNTDSDDASEYLVEWNVAAEGGTAGARVFGLLDQGEGGQWVFRPVDPFSAG